MKQPPRSDVTFLFVGAPTFAAIVIVSLAVFAPGRLLEAEVPVLRQPLLLVAAPPVGLAAIAVFVAHFIDEVRDAVAWGAIALIAVLTVLFFALLHAETGVLCTAPVCPGATKVAVQDPFLTRAFGAEHSTAPGPVDDGEAATYHDESFRTALYFSIVTFTTLGYGDFQPLPRMRLLAAIEAFFGYVFLGLMVGAAIDLGSGLRQRRHSRLRQPPEDDPGTDRRAVSAPGANGDVPQAEPAAMDDAQIPKADRMSTGKDPDDGTDGP